MDFIFRKYEANPLMEITFFDAFVNVIYQSNELFILDDFKKHEKW